MPRPSNKQPTASELEILDVLWSAGAATVREVHTELCRRRNEPIGYTTVLKLMQIMVDKGWVERDETARSHVYRPRPSRDRTQQGLVRDLIDRAFAGSTSQLVLRALAARPATSEELEEIRRYLDDCAGDAGEDR